MISKNASQGPDPHPTAFASKRSKCCRPPPCRGMYGVSALAGRGDANAEPGFVRQSCQPPWWFRHGACGSRRHPGAARHHRRGERGSHARGERGSGGSVRRAFLHFCSGDLYRLFRGVVGHPGVAHAADVGDERDLVGHCRRRAARRGSKTYPRQLRVDLGPRARLRRAHLRLDQHLWRVSGHPAHARDVPEEGRQEHRPMSADLVALLYLLAAVLFILALRGLSNPETSRRGNLFGMVGMAIAIVTTLASHPPEGAGAWALVIVGIAIGGTVGAVIARRVPMTAMPELVAAFHSLVGMAAVLV